VPGLSRPFDYDTAFSLPESSAEPSEGSHNPAHATPAGYHTRTVWPHPLSLATTHGISLPVGTEMFHFPTFPPHTLYIQVRVTAHDCGGVPPFGHPRITARLPTPRGLSQATTSFFGSWCQGIHPVPLKTSTTKTRNKRCSRPLCSSQATDDPTLTTPDTPGPFRWSARGTTTNGRSLRTQQCANDPPPPRTDPIQPPPPRAQAYEGRPAPGADLRRCSTHEHHPRRARPGRGPHHHPHPHRRAPWWESSLERR
jgi:hypothetical protein